MHGSMAAGDVDVIGLAPDDDPVIPAGVRKSAVQRSARVPEEPATELEFAGLSLTGLH